MQSYRLEQLAKGKVSKPCPARDEMNYKHQRVSKMDVATLLGCHEQPHTCHTSSKTSVDSTAIPFEQEKVMGHQQSVAKKSNGTE